MKKIKKGMGQKKSGKVLQARQQGYILLKKSDPKDHVNYVEIANVNLKRKANAKV